MDNTTEPQKPPLLLPEPQNPEASSPAAPSVPDTPDDDLAEVTEIEPRPEVQPVEEIEHHPRERRPQQGSRSDSRRRDTRERRGPPGHFGSHRPRPFVTDSRHRPQNPNAKDAKREILVNCSPEETRVAVVGNVYKGKIENVLPGISSAFVNIGLEKNAYLYVSDVIPTTGHNPSSQIEKMIARNETIMLQVAKEAIGTKGVKVTMDISLPGRFLVYMPQAEHLGVSKNIEDR